MSEGLGWLGIARLGLVQAAIGAMVMISTSLLNRVMVVELHLAAAVPAALVAWHYVVQLSRPLWGQRSDVGRRRTPWIIGGIGAVAMGTALAVDAAAMMGSGSFAGFILATAAYALIGAGVGAAGTSLLALLAAGVAPERRAAAAAMTWIMMIAGIASSAIAVGALVQPFSFERLALVVSGAGLLAFLVTLAAVYRLEGQPVTRSAEPGEPFAAAFASAWRDLPVRRFTIFVFVSMLAFSMQDLILEPFGGLIFGLNPGATTQLSGVHQGGILAGMVLTGIAGYVFGRRSGELEILIAAGCLLSALALAGLALGAAQPLHWPLVANLLVLGLGNGVFSAAAVGAMMALAGGADGGSGMRMGVWGAAQAVAFGLGGLSGAVIVDVLRNVLGADTIAFQAAFAGEGLLFLLSALLVFRIVRPAALAVQPA